MKCENKKVVVSEKSLILREDSSDSCQLHARFLFFSSGLKMDAMFLRNMYDFSPDCAVLHLRTLHNRGCENIKSNVQNLSEKLK
jgi:hypothetical protein